MGKEKKMKKRTICVICLIFVVFLVWFIRVYSLNREYKKRDEVPVIDYAVGEWAVYENEYAYGNYMEDYQVCVTGYQFYETDEYLKSREISKEDLSFSLGERVCLVDLRVKGTGSDSSNGLYLGEIWLYGTDYYAGQNPDLFALENPNMTDGAAGILATDGEECDVTLVYNIYRRDFTWYNWNHMDRMGWKLFLTAFPRQKNIVLQ